MFVQVLFLLFTCVNIIKSKDSDSDEAKYIDLLPEEEKQDFLNRIAQRILQEIKTRSRSDGTSVEISDEILDEHDAYVQRIMQEETEKFKHKRRLGSQNKDEDVENDNVSESKGKKIDKDNVLGHDNTDLSLPKSNIRIKKDTNEDIKQTSESRRINSDDAFTEVPVSLLYDEESMNNIVTAKNVYDNDEPVNDRLVESNLEVEGLSKKSDKSENSRAFENHNDKTDFQFKNEDNSKETIDIHNSEDTPNSYLEYDDNPMETTSDVPRTLIDDFEPEEKSTESKIKTTPKVIIKKSKSETMASGSTGKTLDLSNVKSFLLNVKSTTSFTTTTFKNKMENVSLDRNNEEHITYTSRSVLRSEANSSESNLSNDGVSGALRLEEKVSKNEPRKSTTTNKINKVDSEIILTTSKIVLENTSNNDDTTEHTVQRDGNSKESANDVKHSLRYGEKENVAYSFTPKYPLNNPNILPTSTEKYKSYYHVFEVSNKESPFLPAQQVNSELEEEPHYVPVYNYDPSNAFYTGYNYFGPNYGDSDRTGEINTGHIVYKKLNNQNLIPDYTKNKAKTQNKNVFKSHGNFKFYDGNTYKPRSAVYQNNLLPWKGGFSDISFNPNDYLDLDYYLGRTNDVPDTDEDVHDTSQSFFLHQLRQGKSEDFVDPDASLERNNIKDNIAALRNALYLHKYGKKPKISDLINKKHQLKTKFTKWRQNFDPVLRGLDDTFLIFLPGGKNGQGAHDDKNIAVDYYFSRMNSEEQPLSDSNETYYKPVPEKRPTTDDKSKLQNGRTSDRNKEKVINEKRIQIPLDSDNILKIDLAVKDGKNVNIVFRNVKKPESDKFDAYLNSYVNVVKDMIEHNNKGLKQYQWLGSTVDIQSAIDKLLQLTKALQNHEELHYSDFELIKYILFVFQTSNKVIKEDVETNERTKIKEDIKSTLSAVSNRVGGDKNQSLKTLRKIYKDIKELQEMSVTMTDTALMEFKNFLLDLETSLNKLHEAVKEIATITNYKKQNWFNDLKQLYLLPVNKEVSVSLLLHLATSKLFGVIEDSAKKGLEDNFIIFVQNHRGEVERTREDFIFVLRMLKAIKNSES